ncbi:hypothetical protein HDU98_005395 [Podochytrium sp. JEL0797]|nr:hypothetical protein HDU98_005395 [Podochytrium sp. JEL0797]
MANVDKQSMCIDPLRASHSPSIPLFPMGQFGTERGVCPRSTLTLPPLSVGHGFADPSSTTQRMGMNLPLPFPQQPAPGSSHARTLPPPFDPSLITTPSAASYTPPQYPSTLSQTTSHPSVDYSNYSRLNPLRQTNVPNHISNPIPHFQLPLPSPQSLSTRTTPTTTTTLPELPPPTSSQFEESSQFKRHESRSGHVMPTATAPSGLTASPHPAPMRPVAQESVKSYQSLPPLPVAMGAPIQPASLALKSTTSVASTSFYASSLSLTTSGTTTQLTTPALSPESNHRSEPPSSHQSPLEYHHITPTPPPAPPPITSIKTPAIPYRFASVHTASSSPLLIQQAPVNPVWKKYHPVQKQFLAALHLADDPVECLKGFHQCVRKETSEYRASAASSTSLLPPHLTEPRDPHLAPRTPKPPKPITIHELVNLPLLDTTETCLHMCAKWCKPNVMKALLRVGANARMRSGFTCPRFPCSKKRGGSGSGEEVVGAGKVVAVASPPPEPVRGAGGAGRKRKVTYAQDVAEEEREQQKGDRERRYLHQIQQQQQDEFKCSQSAACRGCVRIVPASAAVNRSGIPAGLTPLHVLAMNPSEWVDVDVYLFREIVQGLWTALMDRDEMTGRTCLHVAVLTKCGGGGAAALVESLIEAVESLDAEVAGMMRGVRKQRLASVLVAGDCAGNTALHVACAMCDLEAVRALVRVEKGGEMGRVVGTTTVGLLNRNSVGAFDVVRALAIETVHALRLRGDELEACLKGVRHVEDAGLFRRQLVWRFQNMSVPLRLNEQEALRLRMRRMLLLEGVEGDGDSIRQVVKLREIASLLVKGEGVLHELFDVVLMEMR